jgi:hypothetical protein
MNALMQDFRRGAKIGLKLAVTGYVLGLLFLIAFVGPGLFLTPAASPRLLDMIWGDD